jgi:hypothetical protein
MKHINTFYGQNEEFPNIKELLCYKELVCPWGFLCQIPAIQTETFSNIHFVKEIQKDERREI